MTYNPGSLVNVRNRDWVVLPSPDQDLLLLKPLGGTEDEITGIYLPLNFENDEIESSSFPLPTGDDIGDFYSARLLYNAVRLSFRNGAGPFRSLAKLSFRPRAYQIVPLIMALRQGDEPLRMLIADDVGIGKTIEALLIVKELIERREIKRFAIICLPHLCEQWQAELKDKFGIDAVIIRSSTQASLDRNIPGDESVFQYYKYQIISVDYIKSEKRKRQFVYECPELIVVDEAHTCARPAGQTKGQQQRYSLIKDISEREGQGLVLLTATPHSGKGDEFSSLLGMLKPGFEGMELSEASDVERRDVARYFVQRRRGDVSNWQGKYSQEETPFPERDSGEFNYTLSGEYENLYNSVFSFASKVTKSSEGIEARNRMKYWSVLTLLRGVMSSPAAGAAMLRSKADKITEEVEVIDSDNPFFENEYSMGDDYVPTSLISRTEWSSSDKDKLRLMASNLEQLQSLSKDGKAATALKVLIEWIDAGYKPVVFCRFINTANYLGEILKGELKKKFKKIDVQVITSEDPDEVRKSRIMDMESSDLRLLIATDCLSEGINLQDSFNAVLHYDLPWNPNRLEQREGRVDRFGQKSETVKTYLLYGEDNPIDGVVLKVLLRKVREIRRSIGISIPFPEDSQSLMDAVMQAVLLKGEDVPKWEPAQQMLDLGVVDSAELKATHAIEAAAEREKATRNIFAQNAIHPEHIEKDLAEEDEAIGDMKAVEDFVVEILQRVIGADIQKTKKKGDYHLFTSNIPSVFKDELPTGDRVKISFNSPTPEGFQYVGRNHPFVEQLCQYVMAESFERDSDNKLARASVIRSNQVTVKTSLLLFRVRNVIEEISKGDQLVAEEALLWGYEGAASERKLISKEKASKLLMETIPSADISYEGRRDIAEREFKSSLSLNNAFDSTAIQRAEVLVEQHERFRKAVDKKRAVVDKYRIVRPVLPMDLLGFYIILPDVRS